MLRRKNVQQKYVLEKIGEFGVHNPIYEDIEGRTCFLAYLNPGERGWFLYIEDYGWREHAHRIHTSFIQDVECTDDLVIDVAKEDPSINVDESSKSVSMVLGYLIYIAYIIFYAALGAKIQNPIFLALSVIEILTVFSHMRYIPDLSDKRVENFEGPSDLDHMLNWVLDVTYYTFAIVLLLLK